MTEQTAQVILLVEDNEDHAFLISRAFAKSRDVMELKIAGSVSAAMTVLETYSPAVILCDYLLPDGTGLEILCHQRDGNPSAPPFVLLTSQGDENIAVAAMKAGATDYIVKSEMSLMSLPDVCRAIMREYEQRQEKARAIEELAEKQKLNETLLSALPYPALLIRGADRIIIAANKIALQKGAKIGDHCWSSFGKLLFCAAAGAEADTPRTSLRTAQNGEQCSICRGDQCLFEEPAQNNPEVIIAGTVWDTHWIKVSAGTYLHYAIDVTEQHKLQNDLQKLIREQSTVLNTSIVGITKVVNRVMVWVNRAMCDLFGYTLSELEQAGTRMLYPSDDAYRWLGQTAYPQLAQGVSYSIETEMRRKDGTLIWVLLHGNAIDRLRPAEGTVWIFEDITERKRGEESIVESEKKYRRLVDNSPDIVYVFSTQRGGIFYSSRVEKVLGYTPEFLYAHPMLWNESIHPNDKPAVTKTIQDSAAGTAFGIEYRIRDAGGNWRWLFDRLIEQRTENGETVVEGMATDITERRQLEAQLRESQKIESIGQLAGGVAHDFNNILTVIMGYCNLLGMNAQLEGSQKEAVEQIMASAEKAAQLTGGLLAFSRKQVIDPKQANLNDIVQHVQKFLLRIIGEDVQLQLTINEAALPVTVDSGQIEQVLINLATNARDAMKKGGLLSLETGLQKLDETDVDAAVPGFAGSGRYACIAVTDSGSGMDEDTRSRIFEPFFTTKEVGKGTGLGMAIVYGIVRQHNGFITVQSEPGIGSTFRVYLPIAEGEASVLPEQVIQAPPQGGHETILLAEDDADVRTLVTSILTRFGYDVIEAEDGQAAVEKFSAHKERVALIVMDVIMPRKSGQEAYEEISRLAPGVKVLYVSGYTADFIKNRGVSEEKINLIMKPVMPLELMRKVREMLDS